MRTPILRRFAAGVHIAALAVLAFAFHKVLVGLLLFCECAGWSRTDFPRETTLPNAASGWETFGPPRRGVVGSFSSRTTHGLCALKALNNYLPRTAPRIQ